ncbi:hypothetical protein AB6A23_22985 [Paenibacillus tarimensis]
MSIKVEYFGAIGDGVTDNSGAIELAFNSVSHGTIEFGPGVYKITRTLTADLSKYSLKGDKTTIIGSLKIIGTLYPPYGNITNSIEGIEFIGPGRDITGSVGLLFDNGTPTAGPSRILLLNVSVRSYDRGIYFGNRTYLINFFSCSIGDCATCVHHPNGVVDSGERMTFMGCTFDNSYLNLDVANPNSDFIFKACSFDYSRQFIKMNRCRVQLYGCHMEHHSFQRSPFQITSGDGGFLGVYGGRFIVMNPENTTADYIVENNSNTVCTWSDVFESGARTVTRRFALGPISRSTNHLNVDMSNHIASDVMNILTDGGFENTAIIDNIFIYGDINSPPIDRHIGTNISLETSLDTYRTGLQSLKVSKLAPKGSNATFNIAVPVTGREMGAEFWYSKLGVNLGSFQYSFRWANLFMNGKDVPHIAKSEIFVSTVTVTLTEDPIDWTLVTTVSSFRPPPWATHMLIHFNIIGMDPGDFYVEDVVIT